MSYDLLSAIIIWPYHYHFLRLSILQQFRRRQKSRTPGLIQKYTICSWRKRTLPSPTLNYANGEFMRPETHQLCIFVVKRRTRRRYRRFKTDAPPQDLQVRHIVYTLRFHFHFWNSPFSSNLGGNRLRLNRSTTRATTATSDFVNEELIKTKVITAITGGTIDSWNWLNPRLFTIFSQWWSEYLEMYRDSTLSKIFYVGRFVRQ